MYGGGCRNIITMRRRGGVLCSFDGMRKEPWGLYFGYGFGHQAEGGGGGYRVPGLVYFIGGGPMLLLGALP